METFELTKLIGKQLAQAVGIITFGLFLGGLGLYTVDETRSVDYKIKQELISELRPYIEQADNRPGISFEDRLDFAKKAGIPTYFIQECGRLDLKNYDNKCLGEVLKKYKEKNER